MQTYPKIQTLYKRDERFKVTSELFYPEFGLIKSWHVTEKIDGQNIRVQWDGSTVKMGAREEENLDNVHKDLAKRLHELFTPATLVHVFEIAEPTPESPVVIFGEGCGAGIQKGGGAYSPFKDFVLFDVLAGGFWLEPENLTDIALKLGVDQAPCIFDYATDLDGIADFVRSGFNSLLARARTGTDHPAEGIIARTVPGLLRRDGKPLRFKLKTKDFRVDQP